MQFNVAAQLQFNMIELMFSKAMNLFRSRRMTDSVEEEVAILHDILSQCDNTHDFDGYKR